MASTIGIAPAGRADAQALGALSRDLIEQGMRWRWTPQRIEHAIAASDMNVAVARDGVDIVGFGIMQYADDEAHLCLLAVVPTHRRQGIGRAIVGWLERVALDAGIGVVMLEARRSNAAARAFYRRIGYDEVQLAGRYYANGEDAVRLARDLWAGGA